MNVMQEETVPVIRRQSKGSRENEPPEFQEPKREWRLRINYQALVRNMPFILFLSGLALVYIANSHLAEKKIRRLNKLSKEIKELKWEYLNVKSDLMFQSKMSEVKKAVEPLGLKVLNNPPQKIVIPAKTTATKTTE